MKDRVEVPPLAESLSHAAMMVGRLFGGLRPLTSPRPYLTATNAIRLTPQCLLGTGRTKVGPMMTVPLDIRRSLLRQHGNFALAYSVTFQPGLEHFGDEAGFLTYKTVGSTALVLSNPIAAADKRRDLITRFIEEKGDICFWQISRPVADILAGLGFSINEMGTESLINLATYNFAGPAPAKRNLRRAYNRMLDRGYTTRECQAAPLNLQELETVSVKWRRTRSVKNREITFLVRPVVFEDEPDVRKFFTFDQDGQLKAFAFFDPVYEEGEVVGYLCSTRRRLPEADSLVGYAQMRHAIETFQQEGKRYLFLGLSPLANTEDKEFTYNWLVRRTFRFAYANALVNRFLYPLQQLKKHKATFEGAQHRGYYAFNRNPSLPRLIKVLRACTLI